MFSIFSLCERLKLPSFFLCVCVCVCVCVCLVAKSCLTLATLWTVAR